MKITPLAGLAALLLAATALTGCGTDTNDLETGREAFSELLGTFTPKRAGAAPAAIDVETMAREGLTVNAGPLLIATLEQNSSTSLFAMRGENGTMRTWMSPSGQALITRAGVLAGTRGFGHDMMSADVDALAAKLRARSAGAVSIELRFLDGLGLERPLPLDCTLTPGATASYSFAGIDYSGVKMDAHCSGHGFVFDNAYIVGADGRILSSRQWISQELGYLTLQTLRD
ncbi:YjbF family lipoprotein [Rhodobacter lacus]|uniref:YjbF family lipoprotein n=1 Tax=Rhodobacter lacus TaxID=1641972 RepID=A0ABW5A677_9RHOB